ncbi:MAG: glycerophosphodiester phosphodiesterase [Bacteroidota bacterium]
MVKLRKRLRQAQTDSRTYIFVLSVFLLTIMACTSNSKADMDIQGHRGCRGLFPENSLPAFEKAIDLGVTTLELDIAITKDKKVVVSHEPYMNNTICLDPEGKLIPDSMHKAYNLYEMTYEDIKQFDCGSKFHPRFPSQEKVEVYKPLLDEVFELTKAKNSDARFNIEIKSKPEYYGVYTPEPEEYVSIVLSVIKANDMWERANLQSFDLNILEIIKQQAPDMPVALLIDDNETVDGKLGELSYKPEIISPYFKLLNHTKVTDLQSQDYQVIPWTINDTTDMRQMIDWKVDGIITDYPDRLIQLLSE